VPSGSPAKCNQWIKISYNGKSVKAKVRDRCGNCVSSDAFVFIWSEVLILHALLELELGRRY
jgi:hypothetical protein